MMEDDVDTSTELSDGGEIEEDEEEDVQDFFTPEVRPSPQLMQPGKSVGVTCTIGS